MGDSYNHLADSFAFGCTMMELMTGEPLFPFHETRLSHHIAHMMQVTGDDWPDTAPATFDVWAAVRWNAENTSKRVRQPLRDAFPDDKAAQHMLHAALRLDVAKRENAKQLFDHVVWDAADPCLDSLRLVTSKVRCCRARTVTARMTVNMTSALSSAATDGVVLCHLGPPTVPTTARTADRRAFVKFIRAALPETMSPVNTVAVGTALMAFDHINDSKLRHMRDVWYILCEVAVKANFVSSDAFPRLKLRCVSDKARACVMVSLNGYLTQRSMVEDALVMDVDPCLAAFAIMLAPEGVLMATFGKASRFELLTHFQSMSPNQKRDFIRNCQDAI